MGEPLDPQTIALLTVIVIGILAAIVYTINTAGRKERVARNAQLMKGIPSQQRIIGKFE